MSPIRDPIHGYIEIRPYIERLLDTKIVQRLRNVKQLGWTNLVYPGANHSRFEHSLGTYYLASRVWKALRARAHGDRDRGAAARHRPRPLFSRLRGGDREVHPARPQRRPVPAREAGDRRHTGGIRHQAGHDRQPDRGQDPGRADRQRHAGRGPHGLPDPGRVLHGRLLRDGRRGAPAAQHQILRRHHGAEVPGAEVGGSAAHVPVPDVPVGVQPSRRPHHRRHVLGCARVGHRSTSTRSSCSRWTTTRSTCGCAT